MLDSEWESLCDGCAKCCEINDTGVGCPFLDTETNRCTVYDERDVKAPWCNKVLPGNVMELHKRDILPGSCAYVRHERGKFEPLDPVPVARLIPYSEADFIAVPYDA